MAATDFIKVRGLQSTPGEGADVSSFEVFQGASCGGGAAGMTVLPAVTTPGTGTGAGTPQEEDGWVQEFMDLWNIIESSLSGGNWIDGASKLLDNIWEMLVGADDADTTVRNMREIVSAARTSRDGAITAAAKPVSMVKVLTDIVKYNPKTAMLKAVCEATAVKVIETAIVKLTNDVISQIETDWLGLDWNVTEVDFVGGTRNCMNNIRIILQQIHNKIGQQGAVDNSDIVAKLEAIAACVCKSSLDNEKIIQALKDLKYNEQTMHIPNSNAWMHIDGSLIVRDGGDG